MAKKKAAAKVMGSGGRIGGGSGKLPPNNRKSVPPKGQQIKNELFELVAKHGLPSIQNALVKIESDFERSLAEDDDEDGEIYSPPQKTEQQLKEKIIEDYLNLAQKHPWSLAKDMIQRIFKKDGLSLKGAQALYEKMQREWKAEPVDDDE